MSFLRLTFLPKTEKDIGARRRTSTLGLFNVTDSKIGDRFVKELSESFADKRFSRNRVLARLSEFDVFKCDFRRKSLPVGIQRAELNGDLQDLRYLILDLGFMVVQVRCKAVARSEPCGAGVQSKG